MAHGAGRIHLYAFVLVKQELGEQRDRFFGAENAASLGDKAEAMDVKVEAGLGVRCRL